MEKNFIENLNKELTTCLRCGRNLNYPYEQAICQNCFEKLNQFDLTKICPGVIL